MPLKRAIVRSALVGLAGLLIAAGPAHARTVVTGKVTGARGYTVNGTATDGSTVAKRLGSAGAFALRFKGSAARGATLHLIHPSGRYYGPIVLAHRGKKSFLALSGRSARLGPIRLRGTYAAARKAAAKRALANRSVPSDKRGKPLGAGKLGVVARATGARAAQSGGRGMQPGEDPDRDGLPTAYDADDDGDLVLDTADSGTGASSAGLFSTLFLGFDEALNANAGATAEQIDPILAGPDRFQLIFFFDGGQFRGQEASGAHVDCFALAYCRRREGTAVLGGVSESSPSLPRGSRWVDYDPDGSGYPNLERIDNFGGRPGRVFVAGVQPRVTSARISPGDTYNVVFATDAGPVTVPTTLAAYFVTTPAITSYSTGGATTAVSYPMDRGAAGSSSSNPIQMESERLTLTFWRPQRPSIPGADSDAFTDLGHLRYGVVPGGQGFSREPSCAGHYSGLSSTLSAEPSSGVFPDQGAKLFPLVDSADDAAPHPARTLGFTVDLGACLRAAGMSAQGRTVELTLTAAGEPRPGGQDRAAQRLAVRLPG